jgi:glycosyltransferase involved in cell wall biosynthesis
MSKLTVVVPAYNESEGLRDFHARLASVLDGLDLESEVLYVDDGSRDDTYAIMCSLRDADRRVSTLKLSRNFGKELALTAGLDHVDADAAIVIDSDLQDPPELIPTFVKHWREGYDVVYGTRASRAGETGFKKMTASGFYRVMERLSSTPIPRDTGDYRHEVHVADRRKQIQPRARDEEQRRREGIDGDSSRPHMRAARRGEDDWRAGGGSQGKASRAGETGSDRYSSRRSMERASRRMKRGCQRLGV